MLRMGARSRAAALGLALAVGLSVSSTVQPAAASAPASSTPGAATAAQAARAPMADPPVVCGTDEINVGGYCYAVIVVPGGGGGPITGPGPGGPGGERVCLGNYGQKIPCTMGDRTWDARRACYVDRAPEQPPKSDPIWAGRTEGAIYRCHGPIDSNSPDFFNFWSATPPGTELPDPEELARRAIAAMNLQAPQIGIVPEDAPNRVGLVGLPTWMWVDDPGPQTWGPISRQASAAGHTVTVAASVSKVVWDMGDGTTKTCTGQGTPYADHYGIRSSPDCGHRYRQAGQYTVTAQAFWTINWAGIGQSGTIPMTLQRSTTITVGEGQVISQP